MGVQELDAPGAGKVVKKVFNQETEIIPVGA